MSKSTNVSNQSREFYIINVQTSSTETLYLSLRDSFGKGSKSTYTVEFITLLLLQ